MLQVFLIYANFSLLFLSAHLYDLPAFLQAERLGFRLYDALRVIFCKNHPDSPDL